MYKDSDGNQIIKVIPLTPNTELLSIDNLNYQIELAIARMAHIKHGSIYNPIVAQWDCMCFCMDVSDYLKYLGADNYLAAFEPITTAFTLNKLVLDAYNNCQESDRRIALKLMGMTIIPQFNEWSVRVKMEGKVN
jgi:hypothetical protein